jgi:hypothetical protein
MEGKMYRTEDKQQLAFKDFYLPFGGKLNPTNRWVQLAQLIPWEDLEEEYAAGFAIESGQGAPAIPFRTALGALIIKENWVSLMKRLSCRSRKLHICNTWSACKATEMKRLLIHQ